MLVFGVYNRCFHAGRLRLLGGCGRCCGDCLRLGAGRWLGCRRGRFGRNVRRLRRRITIGNCFGFLRSLHCSRGAFGYVIYRGIDARAVRLRGRCGRRGRRRCCFSAVDVGGFCASAVGRRDASVGSCHGCCLSFLLRHRARGRGKHRLRCLVVFLALGYLRLRLLFLLVLLLCRRGCARIGMLKQVFLRVEGHGIIAALNLLPGTVFESSRAFTLSSSCACI